MCTFNYFASSISHVSKHELPLLFFWQFFVTSGCRSSCFLKYFLTCIRGSAPSYNSITNSCCVLMILLLHKVRVGTSVQQGAFGQRSQGHSGSAGVSCAGPGAGLDDPHVSLQLRLSRCAVSPSPTHLCRHPRS